MSSRFALLGIIPSDMKLTPQEEEALEIALLYEQLFQKIFRGVPLAKPVWNRNRLPKKKNVVDSWLFRHCWKFCLEIKPLLKKGEIKEFIAANLIIMKINYKRNYSVNIDPSCICSSRSWNRWYAFKKLVQEKMAEKGNKLEHVSHRVVISLNKTKWYLKKQLGDLNKEKVEQYLSCADRVKDDIKKNMLSPYYVVLSPLVRQKYSPDELLIQSGIQPGVIREFINRGVAHNFRSMFAYEFDD